MFEESASAIPSSIWAFINSWFTPTVLFVLLNLMIGTIALTSTFATQKPPQNLHENQSQNEHNQTKISKSASLLQRLKSINFHPHFSSHDTQSSSINHKSGTGSENQFQAQVFETQSHYFFQENPLETPEITAQSEGGYIFEQTHVHSPLEMQTHFSSHDTQSLSVNHKSGTDSDNQFQAQVFETQSHYFFQENPLENPDTTPQSQGGYIFEQAHVQSPLETQTHFILEQKDPSLEDFKPAHEEKGEETEWQTMDEVYSHLKGGHFSRTKSDTEPASGVIPAKLPSRMKKSASLKSPFRHFEEEDIVDARRPATVRETGNSKVAEDDEEVDAKADDFINKFKQQLKLQRLDSILRYKDMVGRATGGR